MTLAQVAPTPRPWSLRSCHWIGWLSLTLILACGGGPQFDGHVYRHEDVGFRLDRVPPTWRRIEASDAALAFRSDATEVTVALHGRCGRDAEDVPLQALTQHLFIYFTQREITEQKLLRVAGREALSTRLTASLDGVPKYFHVVVLKKNTCVYDILQIADRPQNPEEFSQFVSGFSTLD